MSGGNIAICIDEPTDLRIVITALEVVQLRFLGIALATRSEVAVFQRLLTHRFYLIIRKICLIFNVSLPMNSYVDR